MRPRPFASPAGSGGGSRPSPSAAAPDRLRTKRLACAAIVCLLALLGASPRAWAEPAGAPPGGSSPSSSPRGATEEAQSLRVVVTATRDELPPDTAPALISTLTPPPLPPADGAASLVADAPGGAVRSYGGPGGILVPSIRGSSPEQVLVLLDGVRLNTAEFPAVDLADLPLVGVDRVEVLRGGSSALYGADALGGVIQALPPPPPTGPPRGHVVVGSEAFGGWNAGGEVSGRTGAYDYLGSARARGSEGNYPYTDPDRGVLLRENDALRGFDGLFRGGWSGEGGYASRLFYDGYQAHKGVPGAIDLPTPLGRQDDTRQVVSLSAGREHDGTCWGARADGIETTRTYSDQIYVPESHPSRFRNDGGSIALRGSSILAGSHRIEGNAEARSDAAHSSLIGDHARGTYAGALQDTWTPLDGDRLLVFPALRAEHHSDFGGTLDPKLGLSWGILPWLRLKGSAGTSYRAPSFDDLYWPLSDGARGNPALSPERAVHADAGVRAGDRRDWVEAAVYRTEARDLIQWAPDASGIWTPRNLASARMEGVEIEGEARPLPPLGLHASYAWLRAENLSGDPSARGRQLLYRPPHTASGRATWSWGGWDLFASASWVGARPITETAAWAGRPPPLGPDALPGFGRIGVGGGIPLPGKLHLEGRMDRVLVEGEGWALSYEEAPGYPAPGIWWVVALRADL